MSEDGEGILNRLRSVDDDINNLNINSPNVIINSLNVIINNGLKINLLRNNLRFILKA